METVVTAFGRIVISPDNFRTELWAFRHLVRPGEHRVFVPPSLLTPEGIWYDPREKAVVIPLQLPDLQKRAGDYIAYKGDGTFYARTDRSGDDPVGEKEIDLPDWFKRGLRRVAIDIRSDKNNSVVCYDWVGDPLVRLAIRMTGLEPGEVSDTKTFLDQVTQCFCDSAS